MPLTNFQATIAKLIASNRTPDSHLAGGAALNFAPKSQRFSNDLDYFHDSPERVAQAFTQDQKLLQDSGYSISVEMRLPGLVRAIVSKGRDTTKIEWAHDSAWRFMPPIYHPESGYQLHPIDIAINKLLALAGRQEARDFIDILYIDREILSLGALCWAAVGKDPGFTPISLLELVKRRGRHRPEEFERLDLSAPPDLIRMKEQWLAALGAAEEWLPKLPKDQIGCLYYAKNQRRFVSPDPKNVSDGGNIVPHYGSPGGVLPRFFDGDALADLVAAVVL
jgi:hypothetical protein